MGALRRESVLFPYPWPKTCATTVTRTRTISSSRRSNALFAAAAGAGDPADVSEPLQKFRLAARDSRRPAADFARRCERLAKYFDPFLLVRAAGRRAGAHRRGRSEQAHDRRRYPLHAITQRTMMIYHSWDSQNAVAAADLFEKQPVHEPWLPHVSSNSTTATGSGSSRTTAAFADRLKTWTGVESGPSGLERGGQTAERGVFPQRLRGEAGFCSTI